MSKSILKKGLLLGVILLSAALLTGCFGLFTGTVTVSISSDDEIALAKNYDIFVDEATETSGIITGSGTLDIPDLGIGPHSFEAVATDESGYGGSAGGWAAFWPTEVEIPVAAPLE